MVARKAKTNGKPSIIDQASGDDPGTTFLRICKFEFKNGLPTRTSVNLPEKISDCQANRSLSPIKS